MSESFGATMSSVSFSSLASVIDGSRTVAVTELLVTLERVVPTTLSGSHEKVPVFGVVSAIAVAPTLRTRATIVTTRVSSPEPAALV